MAQIMKVIEAHNNVLFTVVHNDSECRAIQFIDRLQSGVYASTRIEIDDLVLVEEVPGFLYGPNDTERDGRESISHIILGLVPPSHWHEMQNYSDIVR